MEKITLLFLLSAICLTAISQEKTQKEKAEALAKNEFSKAKQIEKTKDGVVKEKNRIVESTPVINSDLSFYHGNYVNEDLKYKIGIRGDEKNNLIATLKIGEGPETQLHSVSIQDAFFQATTKNENGVEQSWEGAFINKSDDGNIEFGLGLKLPSPAELSGLQITRIFLKKLSP